MGLCGYVGSILLGSAMDGVSGSFNYIAYNEVVKTATPISTMTNDVRATGGTIFITFGLGGLPYFVV